jgi:Acyl-CoA carboxylase epsilon subunit
VTEETAQPAPASAHVHVVRGAPDDVELAALVAGLAAVAVPDDDPEHPRPAAWSDRSRGLRGPTSPATPGPDAWRWSLRG